MDSFNRRITGEIAEVRRSGGEVCVDWRLPRFLDLPCGRNDFYDSPRFGFCDARWHLRVWPKWGPYGAVLLDLSRDLDDAGPSTIRVIYSLGVRGSGGGVEKRGEEEERGFRKNGAGRSVVICQRSELREQKERLMEGGTLIIECVVKVPGTGVTGASSSPVALTRTNTRTREPNARTCKFQSQDKQGQPQSSDECDICCEAPVDCALNPCGHMIWCHQCALRFREADSPPRCPVCRKSIQTILKIYRK